MPGLPLFTNVWITFVFPLLGSRFSLPWIGSYLFCHCSDYVLFTTGRVTIVLHYIGLHCLDHNYICHWLAHLLFYYHCSDHNWIYHWLAHPFIIWIQLNSLFGLTRPFIYRHLDHNYTYPCLIHFFIIYLAGSFIYHWLNHNCFFYNCFGSPFIFAIVWITIVVTIDSDHFLFITIVWITVVVAIVLAHTLLFTIVWITFFTFVWSHLYAPSFASHFFYHCLNHV